MSLGARLTRWLRPAIYLGRNKLSLAGVPVFADTITRAQLEKIPTASVTDPPTLERVARLYREGGWPAEVEGDAFTAPFSAPSAGPPPWHLYRVTFHAAFGVATAEPHGATRWRFEP